MTSRTDRPLLGEHLHLIPWDSPTTRHIGHDLRDRDTPPGAPPYVETFWLPFLGPSLTWLLRSTAAWLDTQDAPPIPTQLLAQQLGLGTRTNRNSTLANTLARGERYGLCRVGATGDTLRVATQIAPIPHRFARQLHPALQALHATHYPTPLPSSKLSVVTPAAARSAALTR